MSDDEPSVLHIDAGDGGDWIKYRSWDVRGRDWKPIDNLPDLYEFLHKAGLPPEEFKKLPAYRGNVNRRGMEWLRAL